MKKFEDMDQNTESIMEQGKISDADLDQVNGGLFDGHENRFSIKNLLFRKDTHKKSDVVLLPMRPEHESADDNDQQGPKVVRL